MQSPTAQADGDFRPPAMIDTNQAAAYLGLAAKTLANWRASRRGPAYVRIGNVVSYRQQDLDAFIAEHLIKPASDEGRERALVRDA